MSEKPFDVIVVGGGLAGLAITYYLAIHNMRVRLVEAYGLCSGTSGACVGRAQVIESVAGDYLDLVIMGIKYLDELEKILECDLEWEKPGHITMMREASEWLEYEKITARLNEKGLDVTMVEPAALRKIEPFLDIDPFLGGAYSIEGHLNPFKLCMGYARAAIRNGAKIDTQVKITGLEMAGNFVCGLLSDCEVYRADTYILAAGAWTGKFTEEAGMPIPIRFTQAEAFVTEPLPPILSHHVGVPGFYQTVHGTMERSVTLGAGQHRNGTLVVSNAIHQGREISERNTDWGMPAVAGNLWKLIPALENVRVMRSWCAPSPFLPDDLPAIGWLPGVDNLFIAAGFHLAIPTIPVLAQWIADYLSGSGDYSSLEIFSPIRFFNEDTR